MSRGSARMRLAALTLGAASACAFGHHSAAMFDSMHPRTLSGQVRDFQWTSPHCYIQLMVDPESTAGKAGKSGMGGKQESHAQEWSLEMGAPLYLYRLGWRPSTVKPGDKITVRINPLRDGSHGGLLVQATMADGHKLGNTVP